MANVLAHDSFWFWRSDSLLNLTPSFTLHTNAITLITTVYHKTFRMPKIHLADAPLRAEYSTESLGPRIRLCLSGLTIFAIVNLVGFFVCVEPRHSTEANSRSYCLGCSVKLWLTFTCPLAKTTDYLRLKQQNGTQVFKQNSWNRVGDRRLAPHFRL